jgi:hypothetical protein
MTEPGGVTPDGPVDDLTAAEPIVSAGDDSGGTAEPARAEEPEKVEEPEIVDGSAGNAPSAAKLKPARRLSSRPVARPNARLADVARPVPNLLPAGQSGA